MDALWLQRVRRSAWLNGMPSARRSHVALLVLHVEDDERDEGEDHEVLRPFQTQEAQNRCDDALHVEDLLEGCGTSVWLWQIRARRRCDMSAARRADRRPGTAPRFKGVAA